MSAPDPEQILNQHYTDAAPDREPEELVWASEKAIEKYGSAKKAAEETKAGSHSLSQWRRIGELPESIQGYVYARELAPTTADIIRRLESEYAQRLIALTTIEEDLNQEYVETLVSRINNQGDSPKEAIESIIGEATTLRPVTIGFDEENYLKLWTEAGRRQESVGQLCQNLIMERMNQIRGVQSELDNAAQKTELVSSEVKEELTELNTHLDSLSQKIQELRQETGHTKQREFTMDYRQRCLERKGEECYICGEEENIVVHHIDGNRENNSLDNLIPVCQYCHIGIHEGRENYAHWNEKILPWYDNAKNDLEENSIDDAIAENTLRIDNLIFVENLTYSTAKKLVEIDLNRTPFKCPNCGHEKMLSDGFRLRNTTVCPNCDWSGGVYKGVLSFATSIN